MVSEFPGVKISNIKESEIDALMSLFAHCFRDDYYYAKLFPCAQNRDKELQEAFWEAVRFCVTDGESYKIADKDIIMAFALFFNYQKTKNGNLEMFDDIFKGTGENMILPYKNELHDKIDKLGEDTLFMLSIGVGKEYRGKGLASKLMDFVISTHKSDNIASDVSNIDSLPMYEHRNFVIEPIESGYFLVWRKAV